MHYSSKKDSSLKLKVALGTFAYTYRTMWTFHYGLGSIYMYMPRTYLIMHSSHQMARKQQQCHGNLRVYNLSCTWTPISVFPDHATFREKGVNMGVSSL